MAADIFLKIKDCPGESTDSKHSGEIELESWGFGVSQTAQFTSQSPGGTAARCTMSDINCQAKMSKASPKLFLACANGTHLKNVVLSARRSSGKGGQIEYLKVTMEEAIISSYSAAGTGHDVPPESYGLNFKKCNLEFWPQKEDGSQGAVVSSHWDVTKNEGG